MAHIAQYVRSTLSALGQLEGVDNITTTTTNTTCGLSSKSDAATTTTTAAAIVIYNPGIFVDQAYYESADFIIPFENEAAQWSCEYVQENLALLPARLRARSIAVAHTSSGLEQHAQIVEDAVRKNGFAGHFVTGVPGYTEWCCHWDEYVQHAASISQV